MRIEIEKLRANVEDMTIRLREDDSLGHVRPTVRTSLIADVTSESQFIQYDKPFRFGSDESVGRGGSGEAPSPLRYFLSGLGFCLQVWYAKGAALHGVEVSELTIDVLTYMDMRGEHLIDEIPAHPQWIVVDAAIDSPAGADAVLAAVDEANRRCPVSNLIRKAVPMYDRITLNGGVIRDDVPPDLEVQG